MKNNKMMLMMNPWNLWYSTRNCYLSYFLPPSPYLLNQKNMQDNGVNSYDTKKLGIKCIIIDFFPSSQEILTLFFGQDKRPGTHYIKIIIFTAKNVLSI